MSPSNSELPTVRIPEIVAGLRRLQPGTQYRVPEQAFSALYVIETDETILQLPNLLVSATPGDIVAVPRGTAHSVQLAGFAVTSRGILQPPFDETETHHDVHPRILCCRVPTSANPLPDVVPDVLQFKPERQRSNGRLDLIFALLRHHAINVHGHRQFMLRRLAEMAATIFLEDVLVEMKGRGQDLNQASSDPRIRRVINAIHSDSSRSWSLEELASIGGLSRSNFAERFRTLVGITPMAYIADHRLGRAANLLTETEASISQIAEMVGYETDSTFSKAFRKKFGVGPSSYRRIPALRKASR